MTHYRPSQFPGPTQADLDFRDPPGWLRSPWNRVFWCLNRTVRDKILQHREGQNKVTENITFCVHGGFCAFYVGVGDVAEKRMESHYIKNPSHRILRQDFPIWEDLAEDWKRKRDELQSGRSHFRERRSPPRQREYWSPRPRSPPRSHDRECWSMPRSSNSERSLPREYSRNSPSYHSTRFQHKPERSYGDYRRNSSDYQRSEHSPSRDHRHSVPVSRPRHSPDNYRRDSRSPPRYSGSPSRGRSPAAREENFWGRRVIKSHPFSRHYGPTPGAVGRYNSKLSASQIPKQREKVTEWICRDHGLYKGCGMVFFDQMQYNEHKKIRNISRDKMCPMKRKIEEEKEHAEKEARKIDVQPERKGGGAEGAGVGKTNQTLNISSSPPLSTAGDRGVSPPAGREADSVSVRSDGVLLIPELPSSSPLPDVVTSSKPPVSASGLRLPVVRRSCSPVDGPSMPHIARSPRQGEVPDCPTAHSRSPSPRPASRSLSPQREKQTPSRSCSSRSPSPPSVRRSPSPPSSTRLPVKSNPGSSKTVTHPSQLQEGSTVPSGETSIVRDQVSVSIRKKDLTKVNRNKHFDNQKENNDLEDMALLLDKKVVRKQQISLLKEKKQETVANEKTVDENAKKKSEEISLSMEVDNRIAEVEEAQSKPKGGNIGGLKRKSVESSDEKQGKFMKINTSTEQISEDVNEGSQHDDPLSVIPDIRTSAAVVGQEANEVETGVRAKTDDTPVSVDDEEIEDIDRIEVFLMYHSQDDNDNRRDSLTPEVTEKDSNSLGSTEEDKEYEPDDTELQTLLRVVEKEVESMDAEFSSNEDEEDSEAFNNIMALLDKEEAEANPDGTENDMDSSLVNGNIEDEDETEVNSDDRTLEEDTSCIINVRDYEEEEIILYFGRDDCESCPKCGRTIEIENSDISNISINILTGATIIYCGNKGCQVRMRVKNLLGDRKSHIYCGM